jgi:hypothetical protein
MVFMVVNLSPRTLASEAPIGNLQEAFKRECYKASNATSQQLRDQILDSEPDIFRVSTKPLFTLVSTRKASRAQFHCILTVVANADSASLYTS